MERITRDWMVLFKRNLMIEYEKNQRLKDACERMMKSYVDFTRNSKVLMIGSKVVGSSLNVLNLSDASILAVLDKFPRSLSEQNGIQRRLDSFFTIPQYYGGIKDSNILFYSSSPLEIIKRPGSLIPYNPGIKKRIIGLISRLKSLFTNQEDHIISRIDNYVLPKIFKNIGTSLPHLCSESGIADINQLIKEIESDFGSKGILEVVDLRRIETSFVPSFESQFEVEMRMSDQNGRSRRYVFLIQGRFMRNDESMSGLTWIRLN